MSAQDVLNFAILDSHGYPKPLIQLPFYSELGSYPIVYYTKDFESLCAECAAKEIREWMYGENDDPPTNYDVYWEGPPEYCAGCNRKIESASGDPEGDDS